MKSPLYQDASGCFTLLEGSVVRLPGFSIDALFQSESPGDILARAVNETGVEDGGKPQDGLLRAPVENQEVWAAGVTYYKSRSARMEESEGSGGARFYDLVYEAERPELFFKATAARCRGHLETIRVRADSTWDVPEPELTLAINSRGKIFGYTIGNDVSSRSIEGVNPLYLPQAKVYRGSCALGPCLTVMDSPLPSATRISVTILRGTDEMFSGETAVDQIKRPFGELAEFLYREDNFPNGTYLMTGTGIVPGSDFTLQSGDEVTITIAGLGELTNTVE